MRFSLPRAAVITTTIVCVLAGAGCTDPAAIQPGDIRTYVATSLPKPSEKTPLAPGTPESLALSYETPEGWKDRGASGMRLATLVMESGEKQHEVTVTRTGGTLEANVSRWIGQLDPAATPETLIERTKAAISAAKKVNAGDSDATVVSLMDENAADSDEVILGAMIPLDESAALFVKFKGPANVARREQEAFSRFVSSLRWNEGSRR